MNVILSTDSYKLTHGVMLPPGCTKMGSYCESRPGGEFSETLFFGLRPILEKISGKIVTKEDIDFAETFTNKHFKNNVKFDREGWEHILDKHKGRLPVRICAVPEGLLINEGNVLFTIENTDDKVPWLTNHLETMLLQVWYPSTIATISYELALQVQQLHDFGLRGSTSMESAAIGGAAHLLSFTGSDNLAGIQYAINNYDAMENFHDPIPGLSVPAAEHSTIISWGKDREVDAYKNMLEKYPTGIISIVADSYDVFNACKNLFGKKLKNYIDKSNRVVVIRLDSGDPLKVMLKCLNILEDCFGCTIDGQGRKYLPSHIQIMQGDGITRNSLGTILGGLVLNNWALSNVAFGSGGGLLQDCNRDTQRFALKSSWAEINDKIVPISKNPRTDPTKVSKSGLLKLICLDEQKHEYKTVSFNSKKEYDTNNIDDVLRPVFEDGRMLIKEKWIDITTRHVDNNLLNATKLYNR